MKPGEGRRETQGPIQPRALYILFPPPSELDLIAFLWQQPSRKPAVSRIKSNKMAKFLGRERTGTAASYMSCSGSLPQIFSTEFSRSHLMITLADKEPPPALLSQKPTLVRHSSHTLKDNNALLPPLDLLSLVPINIITNINSLLHFVQYLTILYSTYLKCALHSWMGRSCYSLFTDVGTKGHK